MDNRKVGVQPCKECGSIEGPPRRGQTYPARYKGLCRPCYRQLNGRGPNYGMCTDPKVGWPFGDYEKDYHLFEAARDAVRAERNVKEDDSTSWLPPISRLYRKAFNAA